jgi:hypothetical protein
MAHVTFVHGFANKPKADELLAIWRRALGDGGADTLRLGTQGVSSSLVYWADVLYEAPDPDVSAHEGVLENTARAIDGGGDAPLPTPVSPESAAFIDGLRAHLTDFSEAELADPALLESAAPPAGAKGLERVPLPWFIKKRMMAAFLRDVHHYLFNVESAPRPTDQYRVQDEIRRRFLDAVAGGGVSRPHVVVSHSMGTVIAYDCLKRLPDCVPVDGFMTLGSPLGLDEIQDKLTPGWSRAEGFPGERVGGDWVNVFDRLDVVCGLDPNLAGDYQRGAAGVVRDVVVQNDGAWRHSATKYYRQPALRRELRRLLGL